jgi:tetratricopeptide (TPR) repeat protein
VKILKLLPLNKQSEGMTKRKLPKSSVSFHHNGIALGWILLLAVLARILFFHLDKNGPLHLYPIIDETEFLKIGRHIAENGPFYPFHFWHPPLYSYFLGLLLSIGLSLKSILFVQYIMGIAGSALLYLALRKINTNVAFISALIWAVYPIELFIESKFLSENLYIFFSIALGYTLIAIESKWMKYSLAGILSGLLIITKSQFILFPIIWIIILLFRHKEKSKFIITYASLFLLFPLAVILHNSGKTDGKLKSVSSNGPVNLYIGNSESLKESLNIRPATWMAEFFPELYDEAGIQFSKEETEENESYPYLLNSFLLKKTLKENSRLGVPIKNILQKTFIAFHAYETPRNYDIYTCREFNQYLKFTLGKRPLNFPLVLFFYAALIYIFVKRKDVFKHKKHQILLLLLAVHIIPGILFFNAFRYRLVFVPILLFYGVFFYKEYGKNFNKQIVNIVLILLLGSSLTSGMLIQEIPLHETYDTIGDGYFNKGRLKTADRYYQLALENLLQEDPQAAIHSQTFEQKAFLAEQEGKFAEAISYLDQAIQSGQNTAINFQNRASLKYKSGDLLGARDDYDSSIKITFEDAKKQSIAWYGLGITYIKLQHYDSAMIAFNESIASDSTNGKAWANRGILKGQLGNFQEALIDLTSSINIEPGYDKAYCNRAIAFLTLGKPAEAIPDLDLAIAINPNYAQAYFLRAMTHLEIGQKESVCEDLRKARNLGFQAAVQELAKHCK